MKFFIILTCCNAVFALVKMTKLQETSTHIRVRSPNGFVEYLRSFGSNSRDDKEKPSGEGKNDVEQPKPKPEKSSGEGKNNVQQPKPKPEPKTTVYEEAHKAAAEHGADETFDRGRYHYFMNCVIYNKENPFHTRVKLDPKIFPIMAEKSCAQVSFVIGQIRGPRWKPVFEATEFRVVFQTIKSLSFIDYTKGPAVYWEQQIRTYHTWSGQKLFWGGTIAKYGISGETLLGTLGFSGEHWIAAMQSQVKETLGEGLLYRWTSWTKKFSDEAYYKHLKFFAEKVSKGVLAN